VAIHIQHEVPPSSFYVIKNAMLCHTSIP